MINTKLENALRIKVTGKCNRNCFFCHKEGGMDNIHEMIFTEKLQHIITDISEKLNITTIAFTGGEPLLHPDFANLITDITVSTPIHKFSLTTNGTLFKSYDFWKNLYDIGLYKVNISMPDVLDLITIEMYNKSSVISILKNQIELIRVLNNIGILVNINVVVFNDYLYTKNIIEKLLSIKSQNLNFEIVLLPNLSTPFGYEESQKALLKIKSDMKLTFLSQARRYGTSNCIETYQSNNGVKISIKSTKPNGKTPFFLSNGVCSHCDFKRKCQEGFYGLRLEQIENEYYIRLCIYKSTEDVLMKYEDFILTNTYKILLTQWNN